MYVSRYTAPTHEERAISAALSKNTLIELLYLPDEERTTFAVRQRGTVSIEESWGTPAGIQLVPYSPENHLIRHRVVLLPSAPEPFDPPAALYEAIRSFIPRYVELSAASVQTSPRWLPSTSRS